MPFLTASSTAPMAACVYKKSKASAVAIVLSAVTLTLAGNLATFVAAQDDLNAAAPAKVVNEPGGNATERSNEPLPPGAIHRLGTLRFRQDSEVTRVTYASDGKSLATINNDTVIIWDANTGWAKKRLVVRREDFATGRIEAICFSPDGSELASLSGGKVTIWEVDTGLALLSFKASGEGIDPFGGGTGAAVAYSPDGLKLAVTRGLSVSIHDNTTGQQILSLTLPGHRATFGGLVWSKDGKLLVSATLNPVAVAWNTVTGQVERKFESENDFGVSIALSADQSLVAASLVGKPTITIWDFQTGKQVAQVNSGQRTNLTIALSDNGTTLVAGCEDGDIRVWDVRQNKLLREIQGGLWLGRSMAVDHTFTTVALGAVYPVVRQWDLQTGAGKFAVGAARDHSAAVLCAAYSRQGKWIATGGENHEIHIWDATSGEHHAKIPSENSASQLAFDPSGTRLFTYYEHNGVVRVWDIASLKIAQTFDRGEAKTRAFAFSPDGQRMVTVGSNSKYGWHSTPGEETVHVWNVATGEHLREFTFKTTSTESASLIADKNLVVTGSANGEIHVMDLATGKNLQLLLGHRHSVNDLKLNADASRLVSASTDQTIRIWDTSTWRTTNVLKGHARAVSSISLSPNGKILASASGMKSYPLSAPHSHRIRLWDIETGKQVAFFSGHDSNTSAVAFSPDGRRIVSAHDNTTALIWDASAGVRDE